MDMSGNVTHMEQTQQMTIVQKLAYKGAEKECV